MDRRFAAKIVTAIARASHELGYERIVLAASPRMLGLIRKAEGWRLQENARVHELAVDLTNMSSTQVHDYLSKKGVLPARKSAAT